MFASSKRMLYVATTMIFHAKRWEHHMYLKKKKMEVVR